jgi:hypothetical protein
MTPPLATPLVLVSDLDDAITRTDNAATTEAILKKIVEESQRMQDWCFRRFDEYIDTGYYTARHINNGGDLLDGLTLRLSTDLRSVTTLKYQVDPYTPGSGTEIASGYMLLPQGQRGGVTSYDHIRLNPNGSVTWSTNGTEPVNSITLLGKHGYGGQWSNTGKTVASGLAADAAATSFVSSAELEPGMYRIDTEYIYISAVSTTTNTIDRACNGSTAATHANGTAIYRWESHPLVQRHVKRLVLISILQDSSPLFSALIIADSQAVVASDGNPKDVLYDVENAGLRREAGIVAI